MSLINWIMNNIPLTIIVICLLLLLVFSLIILIKLTSKNTKLVLSVLVKIPSYINEAESKGFKTGNDKLNYVLTMSLNYLIVLTKCSTKKAVSQYSELLRTYIEDILSTPQKKGEILCENL